MAKNADIELGLFNMNQMALSCGVSRQAFASWGIEPVKQIGNQKFFRVEDVLDNRIAHVQKKNDKYDKLDPEEYDAAGVINLTLEQAMLARENRKAAQKKNEILEGRLMPVDLVFDVLSKVVISIGTAFDALPLEIKRRYPELPPTAIDAIRAEVVSRMNEAEKIGEQVNEMIDEYIEAAEDSIK